MNQEQNIFETQNHSEINSEKKGGNNKNKLVIIILAIIVIVLGIIFIPKLINNEEKESLFKKGNEKISSSDIEKYNLETSTIWINEPLDITYNIPMSTVESVLNGGGSFTYLHGSSFKYTNNYQIYVDKSLEGNTNLETLASDIIAEKNSDKYSFVYGFGSTFLKDMDLVIDSTKNIEIANIDTTYFESAIIETESAFGKELEVKIIGYSFKYNDEYISVYGELLIEDDSKEEYLKQSLQYIINSIEDYDGSSLQELGGNAKEFYDDGGTNYFKDNVDNIYTINFYSNHSLNGILRTPYESFFRLKGSDFNWDGTTNNILDQLLNHKYAGITIKWHESAHNSELKRFETLYDVISEEVIKVNDVDFNKYTLKVYNNTKKSSASILVVYFFVVNNEPNLLEYSLSSSIYDTNEISDLTSEQIDIIIGQTEIAGSSFINTFRILGDDEKYSEYIEIY